MENVSDVLLTDDQNFLLYFIVGAFFGPDLKEGKPQKSALQRLVQGLPQYHVDDLAGSHMTTKVMENVYYYLVRKSEQSVVVNRPLLLQYIDGTLPLPLKGKAAYLQFDDLFPPKLHQRSQYENQHCTIDSVVFIDNLEMDCMRPGDVERFKRLTGLEYFVLDREMQWIVMDDGALFDAKLRETSRLDDTMQHLDVKLLDYVPSNSSMPFSSSTFNESQISQGSIVPSQMTTSTVENIDQGMIYFPSCPSKEEWSNLVATIKRGFALTGSAASGHVGPVLGLMDIGESEDSYLFRVSLPGVKRDERDFSCEVESDGTVIIKGVTVTGERAVEKFSQVFVMRTQNLCPPGPFSISFKLPGPVDPQQFLGTFGTDGILEGIAWKAMRYRV